MSTPNIRAFDEQLQAGTLAFEMAPDDKAQKFLKESACKHYPMGLK